MLVTSRKRSRSEELEMEASATLRSSSSEEECKDEKKPMASKTVLATPKKKRAIAAPAGPSTPGKGGGGWTAEEDMQLMAELFGQKMPPLTAESRRRLAVKLGRTEGAIHKRFSHVVRPRLLGMVGSQEGDNRPRAP